MAEMAAVFAVMFEVLAAIFAVLVAMVVSFEAIPCGRSGCKRIGHRHAAGQRHGPGKDKPEGQKIGKMYQHAPFHVRPP